MEILTVLTLLGVLALLGERAYSYIAAAKHRAAVREQMQEQQKEIDKEEQQFDNLMKFMGRGMRYGKDEDE